MQEVGVSFTASLTVQSAPRWANKSPSRVVVADLAKLVNFTMSLLGIDCSTLSIAAALVVITVVSFVL